jgi:hypothetical protein
MVPFKVMAAAMIRLPMALHVSLALCQVPANLHGTCGFSPAETKCDLTVSLYPTLWRFKLTYDRSSLLHRTDIGTIRQPQEQVVHPEHQ